MKKINKDYIWLFVGLIPFLFFTLKDLTTAPLWFDEGVEFFYSRYLFGEIPGVSLLDNMYQRIIATYQPPIYNILLFLWLQVSESEAWFRLSSVLMGMIGAAGLFALVKKEVSARFACMAVVIYSCVHQIIYYSLECSEYIMMLMFLFWMLYFYCECLEKPEWKAGIWYLIMAVLAIYSHYSAAFVIIPTAISILFVLWKKKETKLLKIQFGAYMAAVIGAGLPLAVFFLLPQLKNPDSTYSQRQIGSLEGGNILTDFCSQFASTFRYLALESPTRFESLIGLGLIVVVLFSGFYMWKGKNGLLKQLLAVSLFSWIIYYALVRSGIYAYGTFLNRYCLSLLPIWLVTILLLAVESVSMFRMIKLKHAAAFVRVYQVLFLLVGLGYCIYGSHQINKHWYKLDCRGVADAWIDAEAWNAVTFVDFNQNPSFTYYLRHDERYTESMEENMVRDMELHYFDVNSYHNYVLNFFDGHLPQQMYLCGGSMLKDVMELEGYTVETLYETTATLYYAYK